MKELHISLDNLAEVLPEDLTEEQKARVKTLFYKKLSLEAHSFYKGKMQTFPKAGVFGFNWFNAWYTPGVSSISTAIRDNNDVSFSTSNRGNLVGIVSDSTRVLGDGDVTPSGGLGVMEGKAFLMKYLGGVDANALCIDSRNDKGEPDPAIVIDFVKRIQHSYGAINLEDISQPNCYQILDTLREECSIPVWHDDQQGTACVILAGLLNSLILAGKELDKVRIVFNGAGAANMANVRLILAAGAKPENISMFDVSGALNPARKDFIDDPRYYAHKKICETTNPQNYSTLAQALVGADVLISCSKPGPGVIKKEWVSSMNDKSIIFACANPVPEIYPYEAKEAGAFIVGTGRGDFPNQINNSLCFPGILKGALLVRSRKITDQMAIAAAESIAEYSRKQGIHYDQVICKMNDLKVYPYEAAEVAMEAVKTGIARTQKTWQEVYDETYTEVQKIHAMLEDSIQKGWIQTIPQSILQDALQWALNELN
ncbi:MAG TPA: NADP-dependent malic enzyme [Caldisericia bacterium]|nr:NADP-dependent malic enzyme [Caldisericia bacterium]